MTKLRWGRISATLIGLAGLGWGAAGCKNLDDGSTVERSAQLVVTSDAVLGLETTDGWTVTGATGVVEIGAGAGVLLRARSRAASSSARSASHTARCAASCVA